MQSKVKQVALMFLSASMFFIAPAANAKVIWQDFSVSYLKGSNYDPQNVGTDNNIQTQAEKRNVFTFEHASGHSWGGTFLFVDRLTGADGEFTNDAVYGEFSVNPKLFGNVSASAQWEFGSGNNGDKADTVNSFNNYLLGPSLALKVPGASYFNVALYKRFNDNQTLDDGFNRTRPDNEQVTVTWRFDFGGDRIRFDGFLDYATSFEYKHNDGSKGATSESSLNFTPQLKLDLGRMLKFEPKKLWVGVEYVYWNNKFGNENWDERNPNFLLKWHF